SFQIIPTRGMGLWKGRMRGIELGWDSPVDEIVHPSLVNLESRGGLGWLEGFGEWINRCGLASNGSPGVDEVRSNTGAIVPVELTLHGKAAYIPARRVEVVIEPPPSRRIIIRGVVDEVMMFGPKLRLVTEISTVPGSTSLRIDDEIQNLGATPQEMQILYHANFGPPLLEEGSQLLAPVRRVFPRDARAAEGEMRDWNVYGAPDPTFVEQVHFLELFGDADGRTEVVLKNRAGEKGVSLAFSIERLPCLTLWKNTAAKENGYVTGIEPGTNYPNHRKHERARGRVPVLEAKGSYRADLTIEVLPDSAAVTKAAARVAELQTAGKPIVELEPEK
ncbi:MAG TPA: aldose 1-epimerase family protein, partial [Planctomycetota bacterium]|nr:aldose 1-epimerase family protein [Planctomycetota bacterium]